MKRSFITVALCVLGVILLSFPTVNVMAVGESEISLNASSEDTLLAEEELLYQQEEGVQEDAEYFDDGKVVKMSGLIYRYIWIPILLAVCSIAGLIYVNVAFRSNFSKTGQSKSPKK